MPNPRILPGCALLALFVQALFLSPSLTQSALAQEAEVVPATWAYGCGKAPSGKPICQIQRTVPGAGGKGALMQVVITKAKGESNTTARFVVPLAVDLPSGVSYAVTKKGTKGKTQKAAFKTCRPKGCTAVFALDEAFASAMKGGSKLELSFRMRDMKQIGISIDLKGFSIVHTKLMGE